MVGKLKGAAIGAAVAAGTVLVGIPVAVGALGFTTTGIAAGSIAAKMMSAAAIANGGGVAAGSTVAVLQSIGAAGLSLGAKIGLVSFGAVIGAKFSKGEEKKTLGEEKTTPGEEDENQSSDEDDDSDGKPAQTPVMPTPVRAVAKLEQWNQ